MKAHTAARWLGAAASLAIFLTPATAEPPPQLGWYGSTWTTRFELSRALRGGSGIWRPVASIDTKARRAPQVCNGSGVDPTGGTSAFCHWQLTTPADLDYDYEIREFAQDGTATRVTGCRAEGNCWVCQGKSQLEGSDAPLTFVTPHNCQR